MKETELRTLSRRLAAFIRGLASSDITKENIILKLTSCKKNSGLDTLSKQYYEHFNSVLSYDLEQIINYSDDNIILDIRKFLRYRVIEIRKTLRKI